MQAVGANECDLSVLRTGVVFEIESESESRHGAVSLTFPVHKPSNKDSTTVWSPRDLSLLSKFHPPQLVLNYTKTSPGSRQR